MISQFFSIKNLQGERFKQIAGKNELIERDETFRPASDSAAWFHCDFTTYMRYVNYIDSFFNHPLINPGTGGSFDQLKSVALYVFVGSDDFLLDECIELARLWKGRRFNFKETSYAVRKTLNFLDFFFPKGEVCLDVLDRVSHAFLHFQVLSPTYREVMHLCLRRYQEACGLV